MAELGQTLNLKPYNSAALAISGNAAETTVVVKSMGNVCKCWAKQSTKYSSLLAARYSFGLHLARAALAGLPEEAAACEGCNDGGAADAPDSDESKWACELHMTVGVRFSCAHASAPDSNPNAEGAGAVAVHMASALVVARGGVDVRGRCLVPGSWLLVSHDRRACKVLDVRHSSLEFVGV